MELEKEDWSYQKIIFRSTMNINIIGGGIDYILWWRIADLKPQLMRQCEGMAKLVCCASDLKLDKPRNENVMSKRCELCETFEMEDANHLMLNCSYVNDIRQNMFTEINNAYNGIGEIFMQNSDNTYATLLGRVNPMFTEEINFEILGIIAYHIYQMYTMFIKERNRVG